MRKKSNSKSALASPMKEDVKPVSSGGSGSVSGVAPPAPTTQLSTISDGSTEETFRLVIMGAGGVGKTSLLNMFLSGQFVEPHVETIDDVHVRSFEVGEKTVLVKFHDTAGTMVFPAMRRMAILQADAFLFVCSIDQPDSFDALKDIWTEINETRRAVAKDKDYKDLSSIKEMPIVVVLNKTDESSPTTASQTAASEGGGATSSFTKDQVSEWAKKTFNNVNRRSNVFADISVKERDRLFVPFQILLDQFLPQSPALNSFPVNNTPALVRHVSLKLGKNQRRYRRPQDVDSGTETPNSGKNQGGRSAGSDGDEKETTKGEEIKEKGKGKSNRYSSNSNKNNIIIGSKISKRRSQSTHRCATYADPNNCKLQ